MLPFTNAGGTDAEYLSDGIAESLINSFSQIARLRVVPRSVAFRYKGQEVDPRVVARELGVRMLLSGKVVERGGRLSVQVDLVDAVANKQLWGERLLRPLADIFEVEEEIARQIADKLRVRLSGEQKKQLARRYTDNSEAYQLYLHARYHFLKRTPDGLQKGIQLCEQAIEKDAIGNNINKPLLKEQLLRIYRSQCSSIYIRHSQFAISTPTVSAVNFTQNFIDRYGFAHGRILSFLLCQ